MKKVFSWVLVICMVVLMLPISGIVSGSEEVLTEIAYDVNKVTLSAPGTAYSINPYFTPVPNGVTDGSYKPGCLNDGVYVRPSFAQIEYLGIPYVNGKLVESFYIDIDLGAVYDLDQLSITWMSKDACYLVYGSQGGRVYTQIADQSNTTGGTTVTENSFGENVSARYVRIEVLGASNSNYFIIHELDLYGRQSDNQNVCETSLINVAPELTEAITLHYSAFINDEDATDVQMKFVFDGEEFFVDGVPGENHLYTFSFADILPQDMSKNIEAYLYTNGVLKDSLTTYSLQLYCEKMLAATTEADQALRALLVAMLQYGAEAEEYFTGVTDGVSDDNLNETMLGYLSDYDMTQAEGVVASPVQGTKDPNYTWKAATLGCYDTLQIRFKFTATDIENTRIQVADKIYTYEDFVVVGGGTYYLYVKGISVSSFDKTVTAMFLDDAGAQVGQSVTYSINTYVNYVAAQGESVVTDLVQAIYNYGCAAKAYVSALA
ncbi:MAG: discoidin domain-containing protein [Clostridia bacterium]|nr:discoidin domain-containing protein [Clostridia bacterium]